ncbi:glycoside hydrolase family 31 protein [Salinibacterium sp. G-O1]|uniref:glycoside hydrolase family 31 protein n=1 Tax=Salinibacterium sp. G-O1 TaxID=3046208 RepID=UPI0024BA1C52|nr:TIM-barrel domain-containing protein [Salinibacterium sp. G-O1]MDJ0336089.1 glycoside hydrolase family 31 protein [Salinibacterium sp. G-O1]
MCVNVSFDVASKFPEPLLRFTSLATGEELLAEQREHFWVPGARVYIGNRAGSYETRQQFAAYEGERLYGMGQYTHGRLDLKGMSIDLQQRNGEVSIPFVLSSRGYGMLWNNPALGSVAFSQDHTRWRSDQALGVDYWFTASPDPQRILGRYADATGHTPELPEWASGFWQSKLRYRTQDELLEVVREHKSRGLPMSVIVIDYFHWTAMGDFRFDETEWPDVAGMVTELDNLGVKIMVSVWPTVSPLSENYKDFRDRGLLIGADQGVEFFQTIRDKGMAESMAVAYYDPTNPETRATVWDRVRQNYVDKGISVFWLDASEPEINPATPANTRYFAGPGAQVTNIYPRENARLFSDGMAAAGLDQTVLLARSAWAGSQRYGVAVWSGDIASTWESLRAQISAGLSIAIAGIPWWTTDVGGFHGGNVEDPAFAELVVRWFQYGVFCPIFRTHGNRDPRMPTGHTQTGGPNEVWSFGEEAYEHISAALHLREKLRPYIHDQMRIAARDGVPPMRPIFVDFPDDDRVWQVEDQFLFGSDLLVAPVYESGQKNRQVYLPSGSEWECAYTGKFWPGGSEISVEVRLDRIPVFLREGARSRVGAFPLQP